MPPWSGAKIAARFAAALTPRGLPGSWSPGGLVMLARRALLRSRRLPPGAAEPRTRRSNRCWMRRRGRRSRSRAALLPPPVASVRPACGRATPDPWVGWPEIEGEPFDGLGLVCAGVETGAVPLGAADGPEPCESEPEVACDALPVPETDPGAEGTVGTVIE